jgi:hypothetical protein
MKKNIDITKYSKYLPHILISTVLIIVGKYLYNLLGIGKMIEETKQENNLDNLVKIESKKQASTKTPEEWQIIADSIYEDLRYTSLDDNKSDALIQICRVKNDTDVSLLIQKFGYRQEYIFFLPSGNKKNLNSFVSSNLSKSDIDIINGNYQRKNIKYRF